MPDPVRAWAAVAPDGWVPMIDGDVLAPDAVWAWRYAERVYPADRLLGFSLEHDERVKIEVMEGAKDG